MMQEENTEVIAVESLNLGVTKDATAAADTAADTPSTPTTRVYFTEGEMLPWKGRWFQVHLNQQTNRIELEMIKSTAASTKRAAREARWLRQHPRAVAKPKHAASASESASVIKPLVAASGLSSAAA